MATTITMPQLGETVTEGTVSKWLKHVGDSVAKYEAFVEVSTDKVNAEVPSPLTGTIRELIAREGETVATGAPIAIIDEFRDVAAAEPAAVVPAAPTKATSAAAELPCNGAATEAPRLSPAVRRLARERGVDATSLLGTGLRGRITAHDVAAAPSAAATAMLFPVESASERAPELSSPVAARPTDASLSSGELVPLSPSRRIIAQRMVESKHNAPHAWTMVEVDVTSVWAWRTREKAAFERATGAKLTLLPFFMRAVIESLQRYPMMNASFQENGILVHPNMNVGVAIAVEANLVVPVILRAENLSIRGLALAVAAMIERARNGKLVPDDMAGGTFTVNNSGANGSVMTAPILVPGQAGIVTMEAIIKRPVVVAGDAIAIRSMMNVCLSLDHRVVDGAIASGFLSDLKARLETMERGGTL